MIQRQSQNVSLAHRSNGSEVGNNLRVELAVKASSNFEFRPHLELVKARLDHRCLEESLEQIARTVSTEVFQTPLGEKAKWSSVTVWELGRFGCTLTPGQGEPVYSLIHRNLTVSFVGRQSREEVVRHIDSVFAECSGRLDENLFLMLARQIPGLKEVAVDLGRHRTKIIHA